MKEIILAKTAGFCFGVDRAVNMVDDLVGKGKKVATLGPIIHNQQVIDSLQRKGVRIIQTPQKAQPGETVVIRSHGISQKIYNELALTGSTIVDATCPYVAKIHRIVTEKSHEGGIILIAGDPSHPEVQGIVGHCPNGAFVFQNEQQLEQLVVDQGDFGGKDKFLVSQTTFNQQIFEKCLKTAKKVYTNLTIFDTICKATVLRQQEAMQLSKQVDLMVVIGGRQSSNTAKLGEICSQNCRTIVIETEAELSYEILKNANKIGVTAGASTPACIIKEVQTAMSEILNNIDAEDVSFEEALEQSLKSVQNGDKVKGTVSGIFPTEIAVEIGTKHACYVPLSELTDDASLKPEDIVKKGDELDLIVVRVNDVDGTVMLSKKRFDAIAGYEKVCNAVDTQEVLEGKVLEVVKGGVLATTNGVRVFIPASQATVSKDEPLESLLRKTVRFRILEVNRQRGRAVGSIRSVAKEERKEAEEKIWNEIAEGQTYKGAVKSIVNFGVFVDIGGVDGLVHISELSWNRIKHPSEVVKIGDVLEVFVKGIDKENKRISLGYRKTEDNPWEIFKRDFKVDDVVTVKIASLTQFGAFATIIPGIDGLIHVSQISNERVAKPHDVLKVGQQVEAKITEIDLEKKRISLSMKALLPDAPATEEFVEVAE
ncbi:bifunctional 4-hydroxy-3-methylbut-2-enyl diphosphate reductase/30S ribosomal protein S1 [Acetanaerobacterium elongatum]|uniref:4-hydroxy-3-methylbut-2-enyl diphosphate reductase n=1 Tax=Acetanaerobacterium elongatum TaxID=258515 RepID=A0A1H0AFV9_9FIRM|nr:bifunctional 4-hydroxy-3-methylbut-2-enyl diphosphate reductase/30S ribosomal protein S1 [Acetanaerobacterium elongatum]SDN32201.1 4-hydroxy-3-methylbut-2-enyl diphosphate reductase [Acetanaerobacterium elongatum]